MEQEIYSKLEASIGEFEKVGLLYAEAKSLSDYLQELKKVILANQMKRFEGSNANREMEALATKEYMIHLDGMRAAASDELRFRVQYEKLRYQIEAFRSLLSLEKEKIRLM